MTPQIPARFSLIITDRDGSRRDGYQNAIQIPFADNMLDAVIVLSLLHYDYAAGMIHRSAAAIQEALELAESQPESNYVLTITLTGEQLSEAMFRDMAVNGRSFGLAGEGAFGSHFTSKDENTYQALRQAQEILRTRHPAPTLLLGIHPLPEPEILQTPSNLIRAEMPNLRVH